MAKAGFRTIKLSVLFGSCIISVSGWRGTMPVLGHRNLRRLTPGKLPRTTSVTPQRLAVLQQAAKKFEDEYYARKKAEEKVAKSESEFKALQAERDKLLAEMAAIKAANAKVHVEHDLDEETTRSELIDILLNEAGWDLKGKDDLEYEIHGMRNDTGVGYVDYVLWGKDGKPLAVVEAKSARKDARAGEQQAKLLSLIHI